MSDFIKHECGIAVMRLRQPLSYYQQKYGTALYGINKLYLLMQKMHNRGQDGAGVATVKLNGEAGTRYISRYRSVEDQPIKDIFNRIHSRFVGVTAEQFKDAQWLQNNFAFTGEVLLGHLRYGTHSGNSVEVCHPVFRQNNWRTRNLLLGGNFNLTNVDELFGHLTSLGQHPKEKSDTVTVLEKIGHFLDTEVQRLFDFYKSEIPERTDLNEKIAYELNLARVLSRASKKFDGGYVIGGLLGHGDAFVMRDPNGIRPAFYYQDDEVVVVASERPAIQTAFNVNYRDVIELPRAHALIAKRDGRVLLERIMDDQPKTACSFERIYFSRGNDREIYAERKALGASIVDAVLQTVNHDFENTVFSFIPNTAEVAFLGMVEALEHRVNQLKREKILALSATENLQPDALNLILQLRPRVEKIAVKDIKLRTFIAEDASRADLVSHVYDVTYGIVRNEIDNLVLIDDSIVRGTTLKNSIISILSRLRPKRVVIVSSAPQIRYPDCYGIDMSKMRDFVAFQAMVELLREQHKTHLLDEVYEQCKAALKLPPEEVRNEVKILYDQFSDDDISRKIADIIRPKGMSLDLKVIFQTVQALHQACPNHLGDWYFTGNYPTPGGNRVVNKAFMLFIENKDERAY